MKKVEKGNVSEIIRGVMMLRKTYCCLWRPCCDKMNTLPTYSIILQPLRTTGWTKIVGKSGFGQVTF